MSLQSTSKLFRSALFVSLLAMSAIGQLPQMRGVNAPSSNVPNPDGTARNGSSGSFDPKGLQMHFGPNGELRSELAENKPEGTPCNGRWKPGTPVNGIDGGVYAIAIDGEGNVYAGGSFAVAGNGFANNIAKWDGTRWSPLGAGLNAGVTGIAISGNDVYVSGTFTTAGGIAANQVARWNGVSWSTLGSGPGHSVIELAFSGSMLYAVGNAGAPDFHGAVSVWNGSTWSPLGPQFVGTLSDIVVSGSNIYVSREYTNQVFKWNGSAWIDISAGSNSRFRDLAASGSDLYAVGYQYLGPTQGEEGYVARWNGSTWSTLSSGINRFSNIYGVAAAGTNVYIVGYFSGIGGIPAQGIAKWNGSSWSAVGDWQTPYGQAVAVSGGDVYFGGRFVSNAGLERRAEGIAKWNGSNWSDLGDGAYTVPNALVASGDDVYAAGYFTVDGGNTVNRLVKWNGSSWQAVTSTFPAGPVGGSLTIRAVAVSGVDIYIGGYWSRPNPLLPTGFVYKWNGSSWSEIGSGMNNLVAAIAVSGPDVYAGGSFTMAGGAAANRIAKWNGSAWVPLGSGVDGTVLTLELAGQNLYAGGYFLAAGGSPADRIARWDGTGWSALGDGPMVTSSTPVPETGFRAVTSIFVSGTDVYAGGGWDLSDYKDVGFVSKWNGSQWSSLLSCCGFVNTLTMSGGELYAVKESWLDDAVIKWNGSTWSSLGMSNPNSVESAGTIAFGDREIFVGSGFIIGNASRTGNIEGGFSSAGCRVSANFARYSIGSARFDYDGDGKTDVSVFRPSTNEWHILQSGGGIRVQEWGLAGDKMAPADFDGDGKTDLAVFRPAEGNWYVVNSSNNTVTVAGWGLATDKLVPGDYNGDGKADFVVFRESEGRWYRRDSDGQVHFQDWGLPGDKPAPSDFDGDGRLDLTVFRPSEGRWYTIRSSDAAITATDWGVSGDVPVAADYSGDGKADFVVFRPSDLTWYRRHSDDNSLHFITWGLAGDIPAPGDFDGDGKTDLAVFRPSNGTWYIFGSASGIYSQPFGLAADLPTPNAFLY